MAGPSATRTGVGTGLRAGGQRGDESVNGTSGEPVVDVSNVSFAYETVPVLREVTMGIERGTIHGIVGPNGSGKSTLLKIALGKLVPDEGTARLFGEPAHEFEDGGRLGYVSQHSTDDRSMPLTVREVVRMGRVPRAGLRRLGERDHEMVATALERVGITELADRRISNLSGGQKQRAYIARTMAAEADLLALDEPTVGVDVESQDAFYELLEDLREDGITVLLIEHDIGRVTDHADTVTCLNERVFYHGDVEGFLDGDALAEAFGATRGTDR